MAAWDSKMTILEKKKKVTKKFQALGISLDKKQNKTQHWEKSDFSTDYPYFPHTTF